MPENIVEMIISSFLLVLTSAHLWRKLDKLDKNIFSTKSLLICFGLAIIITVNYMFVSDLLRAFISTVILIFYCYYLKRDKISNCILLTIYTQLIVIVSEFIFALLLILIAGANAEKILNTYYGNIFSNVSISLITIFLSRFKLFNKIYNKLGVITDKIKKHQLVIASIILILVASVLTSFAYYKIHFIYLLILNISIVLVYTVFVYFYLKTHNNYLKVYDKYNMTLNSLKEYEDILSRYRVSNHENKNQLLTIRGMVKNKQVASYIDEIIENKIKDNEKLMFESLVIPEGGLRGLIYSKMLLMKENNIEYDLCVDKIIKTTDLTAIPDDLMLSVCNIVGVYLDNAIEAVKDLDEKYIIIEIYFDDTLNIAITNNYVNIDIDKIDKVGYTTKGGNHGYGLSLVKEIIDNNKNITNVRRISDDEFTQEIRIKIKK